MNHPRNHDAGCSDCADTGQVADPRSADEDGAVDMVPCPRCEGLGGYDEFYEDVHPITGAQAAYVVQCPACGGYGSLTPAQAADYS